MRLCDLVEDLQGMLQDAAQKFEPHEFERHLKLAAKDMVRLKPRTLADTLTLVADQAEYPAPDDLIAFKYSDWGHNARQNYRPWDQPYKLHLLHLPRVELAEVAGSRQLVLRPAPTSGQIALIGSAYTYFYYASHVLSDDDSLTTVTEADRDRLLLRATIQAMTELANSGSVNPIQLHRGMGSTPKSGTPAEWVKWLMDVYEKAA